jgi:glutamyl-tRNA reductase
MQFILAGVSLSGSPVEALEGVAVSPRALPAWLPRLAGLAGGGVIVSTCGRTEVYSEAEDAVGGAARLVEFLHLLAARDGRATDLSREVYTLAGDEVVRHLFRVTAGLDSMALGEAQVAGQVSDALKAAGEAGVIQPRVSRLFHAALRTSRRVRQKTGLGRDRVSIPSIGVQLVERSLGDLRLKSALLLGAGETGELVARALRNAGVGKLTVASRRAERAASIARELGAEWVQFAERDRALREADIVITCTASPEHVVTALMVEDAMRSRPDRPLFMLDAGMPRDIDPLAGEIAGVSVRTLADLETIAAEHRESRQESAAEAEALIVKEVARFGERLPGDESEPVIRSLGARAESQRQAEFERALRRLPGLTAEQRTVIEAMSRALVGKMLAEPISYLRASTQPAAVDAVLQVFDLDDDE